MYQKNTDLCYNTDFFHYNDLIRKISGIWIPENINIFLKVIYFAYMIVLHTMGVSFAILETLVLKQAIQSEFIAIINVLAIYLTHIVGIFKLLLMILGRGKIKKLKASLQDTNYQYDSIGDYKPAEIFVREKKFISAICILVYTMYVNVAVSAIIAMYLKVMNEFEGDTFEGTNTTCYNYLTYAHYIVLPIKTKTSCLGYSFYEGISIFSYSGMLGTSDGYFIALTTCLQTQFNILGGVFTTMRARSLRNLGLPKDYQILHDKDNPKLEKEMSKLFYHCLNHLKLLISIRDDLEFMFTFLTLSQTLAAILILASCLFIATTIPLTSPMFLSNMIYLMCGLAQVFVTCWSGNRITFEADNISTCLYESDWLSCSQGFKKSIIITMARMQRPLYLSIGHFSPLTLATAMSVCRGAFSYFTVFKSIQ